jgi:hypothetical protein
MLENSTINIKSAPQNAALMMDGKIKPENAIIVID